MKPNILIIDDEESIRYTFACFLADAGYRPEPVGSFDEAAERLAEDDFDLVFADILLGGHSGIDLLRLLREKNPHCPVVMITGFPSVETAAEAVRLGAYDYIPKPVTQEALLRITGKALEFKRIEEEKRNYQTNLEAIFRSVQDAIVTVDGALRVVEMNHAAGRVCGLTRQSVGEGFASLSRPCLGRCVEALKESLEKNACLELQGIECRHRQRPNQMVNLNISPLLDHRGGSSGAVMVVRDETRLNALERDLTEKRRFHKIIGVSQRMQEIYALLEKLAEVPTTVLVTGESGSGKELIADALHYQGPRRNQPLVKVNCSALSENLLETELFGHVKGAFTGAVKDQMGRFQKAHGGTIFLDEIGDISPRLQLRLLRVLQEKTIEKVGDSRPIEVDVRVVAATNQNLAEKIRRGAFREDLFYRLKVVNIALPPLRERRNDIPLLVEHFLTKLNPRLNRQIRGISADVERMFLTYHWPGNVRELQHAVERAVIMADDALLTIDDFGWMQQKKKSEEKEQGSLKVDRMEREIIEAAIRKNHGNLTKAADELGIGRSTLYRKIKKYGI